MRIVRNPLVVVAAAIVTVFVAGANWPDPAAAATVTAKWGAQIEVAGVHPKGSATLYAYATGTGLLSLRLTGLTPATGYWVGLYAGSCSRLGSRVVTLSTVTSSMSGTVTRGLTLNRSLTTRLRTLARGKLSVVVGSVRRCGILVRLPLSPAATPTPTPTPAPTFSASPLPTPTPTPAATPLPTPYMS